ncbi:uncharacterized protein LOC116774120 isoform X2 [Danaus plexippus]|uniref:uncharacterized protein LOC116774120 isoform X2 n=1 Tax=Danaus plexippus TaxID=13037 RepID=UPI002AB15330|nr:uncharacterized protein LOC116774120 isoform X2 [Danaus plexippus]
MMNKIQYILNFILFIKRCQAHVDGAKVPICGIDSCGEMRTFIDNCDMHEFNCDSKKDFVQKPVHECWVTCKRGRSFKKSAYGANCDLKNMV